MPPTVLSTERPITRAAHGHVLTNVNVWSPDSRRIVYDIRSDVAGAVFDGSRIETVDVETGTIRILYEAKRGAACGVATYHPTQNRVIFIRGPETPTDDWRYGPTHRQGIMVDEANPGVEISLDACDLVAPFTPGALRGGSHVHVFSPDGSAVSFTYEDHVLSAFTEETESVHINLRNVGVSVPMRAVTVEGNHPRNRDGTWFSVLATRTQANPPPGSDAIQKAFEESWIGSDGYVTRDGSRRKYALAFQGQILDDRGQPRSEAFIVDLPEDPTIPGDGPLEGTEKLRPFPPKGAVQRRLTYTTGRKFPGIQGPRHWLRSSPDGSHIAFLMKDDAGIVQLSTVAPLGGEPTQITHNQSSIASAFTWSPNGRWVAHCIDDRIGITEIASGRTVCLTERCDGATAPRPEACVVAPDGRRIAYVRTMPLGDGTFNQIFVCDVPEPFW